MDLATLGQQQTLQEVYEAFDGLEIKAKRALKQQERPVGVAKWKKRLYQRSFVNTPDTSSDESSPVGPTQAAMPYPQMFSPPQARLECDEFIHHKSAIPETEYVAAKQCVHIEVRKVKSCGALHITQQAHLSDRDVKMLYKETGTEATTDEACASIVFCPMRSVRRYPKQIPVSKATYLAIEKAFGLPSVALQVLSTSFSTVFAFTPRLEPHNDSNRGLILNNHVSAFCDFTLICVYDATRRKTQVVCVGLSESEISAMVERVTACFHTAHHFITLPLLLVDYSVGELAYFAEARRVEVRMIRKLLQMETYLEGNERQAIVDPTSINLPNATAQVTSLSQSVIGLLSRSRALMKFADGLHKELEAINHQSLPGLRIDDDVYQSYRLRLEYMSELVLSVQDKLKASYDALQVQSQAIYSLTAQADNAQNLKSAELSRQIAEESKRVAETTLRDSTDMRVIAAVTLFFLPGTFTATLFSTSFFNFQLNSGDSEKLVTHWIWLYWMVTLTLTSLVMGCWWFMSHRQHRKIGRKETDDEEKQTNVKV